MKMAWLKWNWKTIENPIPIVLLQKRALKVCNEIYKIFFK
jgi:hypothetical protein